ncbi:MAG: di-trans,poly-cis-decaprenylcistransferase [Clostridia bacterium]|nr:di-trans,poly-cis-decaprenylcistransferase [Clostridia bacterium]
MDEKTLKNLVLPRHIGFIMDGNGRWATARGLERSEGHKAGAETFRTISTYCAKLGIESVTFYAFSTENWKRPKKEVGTLMKLFRAFLEEAQEREGENEALGFRIKFAGDMTGLPKDLVRLFKTCESRSADKTGTTVNIAVNYGGRAEITAAVRKIAEKVRKGEMGVDDITEDTVSAGLYTAGQPDPDLIIRPGGESRLSNFLIWQAAYSEFYFTDILWPDFTPEDLDKAIIDFCSRNRRFGAVK